MTTNSPLDSVLTLNATCPLCGQLERVLLYRVTDRHYGIDGTFDIKRCATCELVFLDPMPTEEFLESLYPSDYYSYVFSEPSSSGWKAALRQRLLPLGTRDPHIEPPGVMLDVGCGNGWMLERYKANGWEVYGVELNEAAVASANHRGLNVRRGTLLGADFSDSSFDYVRLNHSFEHMNNPSEVLQEIRRILKTSGLGFIGVPDISGAMAKVFRSNWYYIGAPVHCFNWSRQTLRAILEKEGFEIVSCKGNSDFGGTLGSAQIWLNRNSKRPSDQGVLMGRFRPLLAIPAFWLSKLLDRLDQGDCVEIVFKISSPAPHSPPAKMP